MVVVEQDGSLNFRLSVASAVCGIGITEVRLDYADFMELYEASDEQVTQWIERMLGRFTVLETPQEATP